MRLFCYSDRPCLADDKPAIMRTKNTKLVNPQTGDFFFGYIPDMPQHHMSEGGIILRYGQHRGANRGFGVVHIWAEHCRELSKIGFDAEEKVPEFINSIIRPETPIYCEFSSTRGDHRLTVLRTTHGLVVLEPTADEFNNRIYSVVTAFTKRNAHGTLIGKTKSAPKGADS